MSLLRIGRDVANYTIVGYENGLVEIRSTNDLSHILYSRFFKMSKVVDVHFFKDEFGSLHVVHENDIIVSSILSEKGDDTFEHLSGPETTEVIRNAELDEEGNSINDDYFTEKILSKMVRHSGLMYYVAQIKCNLLRFIDVYEATFTNDHTSFDILLKRSSRI